MSDGATLVDHAPGLERLFATPPAIAGRRAVVGSLPPGLHGRYLVNGPAQFARGGVAYRNWLDGDGYVAAVRFDGPAAAEVVGRFVDCRRRVEEEAAGSALYRAFGTAFAGDRLLRTGLASPVNVSIHPFAGRLLAFGEQGLPWRLDPESLATLGEEDFGRLSPLAPFSAHPAFDPASGEMVNFGISFAADRPILQLFVFTADGTLRDRFRLPLAHPYSVHDFALTPRFAVFHLAPYLLDVGALLAGGATVLDALAWRPGLGTRLLVVSRADGSAVLDLPLPASPAGGAPYCLHHVNAFEDGDAVVLDLLELEEPVYPDYQGLPEMFGEVAPAHPVRLTVDVADARLVSRREIQFGLAADFPAHDPALRGRPCRDAFVLAIGATGRPGRKFFDRLVRLDWDAMAVAETWQAPAGRYLGGEPVVVRTGDSEVVLVQEHEPGRETHLLVLDAHALARGPRAVVGLGAAVPPGFHAVWQPAT